MKQIITITGAGGTVGMSLTKYFLKTNPDVEIRAIERSETVISQLIDLAMNKQNLKIFLADLNNYSDTEKFLESSNIIIHCAALKHVMVGSVFPEELAYQNINCFCNVVKAAKKHKVEKILLCSTDKSATPTSVMGASKLLLEKIVCFSSNEFSKFSSVRFGNILNSSGSIIPRVMTKLRNGERVDISHKDMTRYFLTENDFLNLVGHALDNMQGGEIFIPKARSLKVYDLVRTLIDLFCKKHNILSEKIAVRVLNNPYHENINERMINPDEINFVRESENYFTLSPLKEVGINDGKHIPYSNLLSSSKYNLSKKELNDLIKELRVI